jgi:hypothetical protein
MLGRLPEIRLITFRYFENLRNEPVRKTEKSEYSFSFSAFGQQFCSY